MARCTAPNSTNRQLPSPDRADSSAAEHPVAHSAAATVDATADAEASEYGLFRPKHAQRKWYGPRRLFCGWLQPRHDASAPKLHRYGERDGAAAECGDDDERAAQLYDEPSDAADDDALSHASSGLPNGYAAATTATAARKAVGLTKLTSFATLPHYLHRCRNPEGFFLFCITISLVFDVGVDAYYIH